MVVMYLNGCDVLDGLKIETRLYQKSGLRWCEVAEGVE